MNPTSALDELLAALAEPGAPAEFALLAGCLALAWALVRAIRGKAVPVESIWFGRRIVDGVLAGRAYGSAGRPNASYPSWRDASASAAVSGRTAKLTAQTLVAFARVTQGQLGGWEIVSKEPSPHNSGRAKTKIRQSRWSATTLTWEPSSQASVECSLSPA